MIDIIIPVYNGYEHFKNCLDSVLKYTTGHFRIIIVNDYSKEDAIKHFLNSLKKHPNQKIVILDNSSNLGFVKSINRGIKYGKSDVVLLNSDTIVTKCWLTKLNLCAYSNTKIATATPLSNNAAIYSIPNIRQKREIPPGHTIESWAKLINTHSLGLYPEIPTGVGFCMYIKRSIINQIGLFNEEKFSKGYGEENDFCMRAKKAGFLNILDDTTFIYHKGGVSFTSQKSRRLKKKNMEILKKLHPDYLKMIKNFRRQDVLKQIKSNLRFWLKNYDNNSTSILFIKHFEPNIGGVGINTDQIIKYSLNKIFYIFYPNQQGNISLERWECGKNTGSWNFPLIQKCAKEDLENKEIEQLFKIVLQNFNISLVHFQHLLGLPLSLIKIPSELNIPTISSLHDYFLLCSNPHLNIYHNGKDIYYPTPITFIKSIRTNSSTSLAWKREASRFKVSRQMLAYVNFFISPSNFVKESFTKIFSIKNITVIDHGTDLIKNNFIKHKKNGQIVAAFLGAGSIEKGIADYLSLAADKKIGNKFKWVIIGPIDPRCYDLEKVNKIPKTLKSIRQIGLYDLKNLPKILKQEKVDLVVLPSLTPETFSYTLSESIQSGLPVIGRNIGALGERIKQLNAGWVFNDYSQLVEILEEISKNHNLLYDKQEKISTIQINSSKKMVEEYDKIYKNLIRKFLKNKGNSLFSIQKFELNRYFYSYTNNIRKYIKPEDVFPKYNRLRIIVKNLPYIGSILTDIYRKRTLLR